MTSTVSMGSWNLERKRPMRKGDPWKECWVGSGPDHTAKQDNGDVYRFTAWPIDERLAGVMAMGRTEGEAIKDLCRIWRSLVRAKFFWPDGRIRKEGTKGSEPD